MTDALGELAGGVGLFLLGMWLMTDGLRFAAGPALERILERSTETRLRGLAAGAGLTALLQSSSAVTVATIGFVNAGLLSLAQAMWVLFGANVGTTATGWIVAAIGLKLEVDALALPLIGTGMLLRMTSEQSRRGAVGTALAGFGLLFLGIDFLRGAFTGMGEEFRIPEGGSIGAIAMQLAVGLSLTVLMQSSSAALTVAISAAQGGLLSAQGAAAVVIGSNVGTTVTALIAAVGATPNARRAAMAHVLFNLITGVVALGLLPWLLGLLSVLRDYLGWKEEPAMQLALFHTVFNVLGVLLVWPLGERMATVLGGLFRGSEYDEGRPRHIDRTLLAVPSLALDALQQEIQRMRALAAEALCRALEDGGSQTPARNHGSIARLLDATASFIVELNRDRMSADTARRLPEILRAARYYESSAAQAVAAAQRHVETDVELLEQSVFHERYKELLQILSGEGSISDPSLAEAMEAMQSAYHATKARWLEAGSAGEVAVAAMDASLRRNSLLRRAIEQLAKGVKGAEPT